MPLVLTAAGIGLLLILIMRFRVHAFIALAITSVALAFALRIPASDIMPAIQDGFGNTLATAGLIFGFGAILGRLMGDAGGSQRIAVALIERFGRRWTQWAVVAAALILGVALFFEVGIVILVPIVYQMAKHARLNIVWLGLPMATGLSVMHAFLPPTPGPVIISQEYGATISTVLLYGALIAVPTTIIAGPLFTKVARAYIPGAFEGTREGTLTKLAGGDSIDLDDAPSFGSSVLTALFPVMLLLVAGAATFVQQATGAADNLLFDAVTVFGEPSAVMLLSVLLAIYTMGIRQGRTMPQIMTSAESGVKAVGMLLLILGISGSLKEVLLVGGVGDFVADLFSDSGISPLVLAWLVAAMIRLAQGSATVSALTTVALVLPIIEGSDVNAALMVLATGAGSIIASHVNDTGFWIIKESFGLSVKETLATWTVLETVISVCGLVFVLLLNLVV